MANFTFLANFRFLTLVMLKEFSQDEEQIVLSSTL